MMTSLLVYVGYILITSSDDEGIQELKSLVHNSFKMKDLRPLTYFLGLEVNRFYDGYMVNQHKYAQDLLKLHS